MKRLASTLALVLGLGGCSLIVDDRTPPVTNHCTADADCASGAHCDPAGAMCVQEPVLPYDLWLEVAPPDDPTGTAVPPVDLGPYTTFSGAISLVTPRPITMRGTVRRDGVAIAAQVAFTPSDPSPVGARTISARTATTGELEFTTALPSRGGYQVVVMPQGEFRATVPPFHSTIMVGATDTALSITLPTDEMRVAGRLVVGAGDTPDGFEVLAVDRATGNRVSSVATTASGDAEPGAFSIALPAGAGAFDLVIRPTAARQAEALVPTYRVRPELLIPDADGLVSVLVPTSVPPVHWAGTVEYPESRGMRAVAGAVVQLHSEDVVDATTGVVGTLDITLMTDDQGRYDGMVLPGTYTISITPAADEELGVLRETRDLRPASGASLLGHVFHLPLRTVLGGTVQSPDGDLVRNAQVRATPLGVALVGLTDPEVARLARPSSALSGPMGDFRLELDVGVYDIVVQPPDGSGFAWTVLLGYGIGGSTATLADVMQVDAPVIVDSDVTWLDGGALPDAEIRAMAITPDHRVLMVARTTTDAHGHARLLVPATLGSHDPTMAARRP